MEEDYDSKFEKMKKYIPFLEWMIKRLVKNRTTSGNPRQAQLAKIRWLRDLLLDKKQRMKMKYLLKCEQVLINLYTKVEQTDCFSDMKNDVDTNLGKQNEELILARNKLKNIVSYLKNQETLPEIARTSYTEEASTVSSQKQVLFQRRSNKTSMSPPRASPYNSKTWPRVTSSNRSYSRVLISPEPDTNWPQEKSPDTPLYSRRSPQRTPKKSPPRRLSTHNQKEIKKSTIQSHNSNELKDVNITLKFPEASLNSLNTKDIVSRIINCNDNDVDIDTLRGPQTQILSELKQRGAKDDISDLILQSYKNKKEIKKKNEEIEEGKLTDNKSEVESSTIVKTEGKINVQSNKSKCDEAKNISNDKSKSLKSITPNFYKPLTTEQFEKTPTSNDTNSKIEDNKFVVNECSKKQEQVEIQVIDPEATAKQEVVYEIDILPTLKKEILSEKISLRDSESPPLHQPKVTKVANIHGIITTKRISIETFKEKASATSKPCLFPSQTKNISTNDELLKKQSVKLTEKKYERLNLSNKLAFDESLEDEDMGKRSPTIADAYRDLVPKFPDREDYADTGINALVIVSADPIKTTVDASKADIDIRLPSAFSPSIVASNSEIKKVNSSIFEKKYDNSNSKTEIKSNKKQVPLGDTRFRREFNHSIVDNSMLGPVDLKPLINFPSNVPPSMMPDVISNRNPNIISGITQNSNVIANPISNTGVYEMSPSRQTMEKDDYLQKNILYTSTHNNDKGNNHGRNRETFSRSRNDLTLLNNYFEMPMFEENHIELSLFNRLECPRTPVHPFRMSDCPPTSTRTFGHLEAPTPIPAFGRCDAPMISVHQFGLDCPPTPNHFFSGKMETKKYDLAQKNYSDNYRHYGRQQSNSRSNQSPYEQCNSSYNEISRREFSIGHSMSRNYSTRQYSTERRGYRGRDYRYKNDNFRNINDGSFSRNNFNREQSIGQNLSHESKLKRDNIDFKSNNVLSVQSHAGRSFIIDTSVNRSFQGFKIPTFDSRRRRASSVGRSFISEQISVSESTNTKYDKRFMSSKSNNNLRRVRSVEREIAETQEKKNFKDVKEELQSYKYKHDETFNISKTNYSNKTVNTDVRRKINERDPRISRRDDYDYRRDKNESRIMKTSTPRGYYRDPRLHCEYRNDSQNKYHDDTRGGSRIVKKHGIVYSADKIPKATMLGSGYGFKTYKIPEIKKVSNEADNQHLIENDEFTKNKTIDESCSKKEKDDDEKLNILKQKYEREDGMERLTRWNSNEKTVPEGEKDSAQSEIMKTNKELKNVENDVSITIPDNVKERIVRSSLQNSLNESNEVKCESPKRMFNKIKDNEDDSDEENTEIVNIISTKEECLDSKKTKNGIQDKIHTSEDKDNDILRNENEKPVADDLQIHYNDKEILVNSCSSYSNTVITEDLKIDVISNPVKYKLSAFVSENKICPGVEFEMFSDNVTTDPVIENINALIADQDNDLKSSKNGNTKKQLAQKIILENNITCTNEKSPVTPDEGYVKKNKSDLIENNKKLNIDTKVSPNIISINDYDKWEDNHQILHKNLSVESKSQSEVKTDENIDHSEVSTTDVEKSSTVQTKEQIQQHEDHMEPCSTHDSKIEVNEKNYGVKLQEGVPDYFCSDNTSTHISHESTNNCEINRSQNDNKNDSIDSFFSILKDKLKMKELLSILQDQSSENYKLKKKLEKLSEIVSDDEDVHFESHISDFHNNNVLNNVNIDDLGEPAKNENVGEKEGSNQIDQNNDQNIIPDVQIQEHERSLKVSDKDQKDKGVKCAVDNDEKYENQNDTSCSQDDPIEVEKQSNKKSVKNIKAAKKDKVLKDTLLDEQKCLTRADSDNTVKPIRKRELEQLQDDIKEMSMYDDFTKNNTGIKICRLAKPVEDKSTIKMDEKNKTDSKPVVLLEKVKSSADDTTFKSKITIKKETQKEVLAAPRDHTESTTEQKIIINFRPGPKSKTKVPEKYSNSYPYVFKSNSFSESTNTTAGESKFQNSSESECESLESSDSFESTKHSEDIKKSAKCKRPSWRTCVIKPKYKKKKVDIRMIHSEVPQTAEHLNMLSDGILDENCFTDIMYCYKKHVTTYSCRFCAYNGNDIVHHYKKQHPHSEIPLSRLSPESAKAALKQCHGLDFQMLKKVPSDKYICRFCFKGFANKKNALEAFFWHVLNMHTGEYKQLCSECVNVMKCPFKLNIPPAPKQSKGQLTGYVCYKCNYTQVSLENLKSHVINRHDNIETEVFEINLSVMTKKFIYLLKSSMTEQVPRVLRSIRLNQSTEYKDVQDTLNEKKQFENDIDKVESDFHQNLNIMRKLEGNCNEIQPKITFENDDVANEISKIKGSANVYLDLKRQKCEQDSSNASAPDLLSDEKCNFVGNVTDTNVDCSSSSDDIFDYPHFKVRYTETGIKEYYCCINGTENHFKTLLLISFKKHVQIKHKEKWDGFCFVCKLIVTTQGDHYFKDCLEHFLDKHMDNFPELNTVNVNQDKETDNVEEDNRLSTTYLNVRPLSKLITKSELQLNESPLPVIESVVSLGAASNVTSQETVHNFMVKKCTEYEYKYEEAQAGVIGKKNSTVLGIMMSRDKLVHIFKCAGRFCSYTTDNAEDALRHVVAHERVGGENFLDCAYCDFDASKNAVDLVTHVFKLHGSCPFICGYCFYHAAARRLVRAHQLRHHKKKRTLIYRSTVTARSNTLENILPREVAVPFYDCNQDFGVCRFKTYNSGKFSEHLQTRHQADSEFSCGVCQAKLARILDLIEHMKCHGRNVYQCTWCIHGADSETELLAHCSEKHPNKQPLAYLRIITHKEEIAAFIVLPSVQFNNSKVATTDVVLNSNKGNPAREAERSVGLEKLNGQTTQIMEYIVTNEDGNLTRPVEMFDPESLNQSKESSLLNQKQEELSANASPLAVITPIPPSTEAPKLIKLLVENTINKKQILLKPEVKTPEKCNSDVVYCIDSDDESPGHNSIDLPTRNIPSTSEIADKFETVRVPLTSLFKCGLCRNTILKNAAGFKRHVTATHRKELDKLTCAHCSFIGGRDAVVKHYVGKHNLLQDEVKYYVCGVCYNKYTAFSFAKTHLQEGHNLTKLIVSSIDDIVLLQPVERKLSGKRNGKNTPAVKVKKFGPHDVDSLPITPILDELVYCAVCKFSTKVRLNMVRHLQLHAEQQPVPQTNPFNPVPHLETNEKYFEVDKSNMVEQQPVVNPLIPPETISSFPKYVPDWQRYTCGAKGCCYTSVDENMFKYHWETLHSEKNDYRCIHCPPQQHLENFKPVNAAHIIAHLKMHDIRLYACSSCLFYHNRRQILEKHITDNHTSGHIMVIREESEAASTALTAPTVNQPFNLTPTMDLKPWQCGLCKFKSMLRAEVADHCAKVHQSKMQYKCTYCTFRTSNMENITKHKRNSHAGRASDTFYFYYREGSIPDEPDGTPRWQKQRQKNGHPETIMKIEAVENKELELLNNSSKMVATPLPVVDLKIIQKDPDADRAEQLMHDFGFGQFCEPNGLKYKCLLCETVSEETRDAMQSHLYEELQYRKWACGFCSYKTFHKNGLKEHMNTEHRQYREPIELPVDSRVEIWIAKALDYQFLLIEKNRQNMVKQTVVNPSTVPSASQQDITAIHSGSDDQRSAENLQNLFGRFGAPEGMQFRCPKCDYKVREETLMRDHMEIELHKIRWCCNSCTQTFQNYHEAQFHCKIAHAGITARAVGAVRDVAKRAAWISALLVTQRHRMTTSPVPETTDTIEMPDQNTALDNSLLVVRYEERIPTPEVEIANLVRLPSLDSDEDEQRLVIDESSRVAVDMKQCIFCTFKCKGLKDFKKHINQHTNIKPYFCLYCDQNGYRTTLLKHLSDTHKGQPVLLVTKGRRALGPPLKSGTEPTTTSTSPIEDDKLICLRCEKPFTVNDAKSHLHDNVRPSFAKKGDVVVKCCVCLSLHQNIEAATTHHEACHPNENPNYVYYKLKSTKRSVYCCAYCEQQYKFWRDFKVHWKVTHISLPLQFNKRYISCRGTSEFGSHLSSITLSDGEENLKRKSESPIQGPAPKMCARKFTSKLPVQSVAKKSTSKLPFTSEIDSNNEKYCYYGSKPSCDY